MTGEDDDADSFLRAMAAAPALRPPERLLTAMLVRWGVSAATPAQRGGQEAQGPDDGPVEAIDRLRALAETRDGKLTVRDDGLACVVWTEATRAAGCAVQLRDAVPSARIALATGPSEAGNPGAVARISERAEGLLAGSDPRIRIDDQTATLIEPKFELVLDDDGAQIYLVAALGTSPPAHLAKVIGNYRVVRLLGTGGMGVVYLAEHVTLGRKAVIKFVQDRLAKDKEYSARFFTEAKTAASIRHPGIVDVFDYGQDDQGRGYIVMELLEGESLRTRLARQPVSLDLAIGLAAQISSAVAAAHAAGVIHRDLKPDNLFIVPDPDSPHRVRAKVLDFGLAKVTADPSPGLTQTGNFVGTPLYMSPEQCRSKAGVDHRTDIYSLGCILFEMVCRRPPFGDQTVGDLIIAHNTTPPPTPSSIVATVPPALDRAILRMLAKHPDDRYATMKDVAAVLGQMGPTGAISEGDTHVSLRAARISDPPPVSGSVHPAAMISAPRLAAPPRRARWPLATVGVLVISLASVAIWAVASRHSAPSQAVIRPDARPAIAVVDFTNQTRRGDADWLATALDEVVTSELRRSAELQIIPTDEVARANAELGPGEWSADRLAKVRASLGAGYLVAGTYRDAGAPAGGQLLVDLQLYDTTSGATIARSSETGPEANLSEIALRLANTLKRQLGVPADDEAPTNVVLPASPTAAKAYAQGLAKLRMLELGEARDLFTKAVAADPNDPLIHSALATVWRELGYDTTARTEAKLAFDFSTGLPRENQLAIEAQYRESTAQWDQTIKAYRTLHEFFPARLEYGLSLAGAQTHAGDAKSAYATLATLRKLPHPLGDDPRIELAEAGAAEAADDMERTRSHAERAALFARKRGARQLLAKALLKEGWALWTLGRDDEADPIYAEAKQLFADTGDRSGLARTLNNIALASHRRHRDGDATLAFGQALALAEQIGDAQTQAWVLNNWAVLLTDSGELGKALELYEKKLKLLGERGDAPSSQAAAHGNIAEISRWRGELATARHHCEAAEDLLRGLDSRRFAAYAAAQCGEVLRAEDDLPGAKKRLEQATGWASDVMTPAEAAEIRIAMAGEELDAGRPGEAEAFARTALTDLRAAKENSQQVCAVAVLAAALLARNQTADAAREIAATRSLPAEGVSLACRFAAEAVSARVSAATDPSTSVAALAALEELRERAAKATFVQLELQLRLEAAELELHAGKPAAARDRLRILAREAGSKGFKLVARRAKEL